MTDRKSGLPGRALPEQTGGRVTPTDREQRLGRAAAQMVETFLAARDIGKDNVPIKITQWPYVRYLVWDDIQEKLGLGESKYRMVRWRNDDKFLGDLRRVAQRISAAIPNEVQTVEDWTLMRNAATFLFQQRFGHTDQATESDFLRTQRGEELDILNASVRGGMYRDSALAAFFDGNVAVVDEHPQLTSVEESRMKDPKDERLRQRDLQAVQQMTDKMRLPKGYELHRIDSAQMFMASSGFARIGITRVGELPDGVTTITEEKRCIVIVPVFDEQDRFVGIQYLNDFQSPEVPQEIHTAFLNLRHNLFSEPERPKREPNEFEKALSGFMEVQQREGNVVTRGAYNLVVISGKFDDDGEVTTAIRTEEIEEDGYTLTAVFIVQRREGSQFLTILRGASYRPFIARIPLSIPNDVRGWEERRLDNKSYGEGKLLFREEREEDLRKVTRYIQGSQFNGQLTREFAANLL